MTGIRIRWAFSSKTPWLAWTATRAAHLGGQQICDVLCHPLRVKVVFSVLPRGRGCHHLQHRSQNLVRGAQSRQEPTAKRDGGNCNEIRNDANGHTEAGLVAMINHLKKSVRRSKQVARSYAPTGAGKERHLEIVCASRIPGILDFSEQNGIALTVSPQRRASTGTRSRRMAARRNKARHDRTAELLMMVVRAGADNPAAKGFRAGSVAAVPKRCGEGRCGERVGCARPQMS